MDLADNLIINLYSIALLAIICWHASVNEEKEALQYKLFMMILQTTMLLLAIDVLSRFDGEPGTMYPAINHIGNFLIFLLNPILPSLWLLYVHVNVFQEEAKTRKILRPLLAVNALNAAMVVLSQFFGWYYAIDSDNIYRRGPLFLLPCFITFALLSAAFVLILANRRRIKRKHYFSLIFFAIPPFACIILQIFFYGISLVLNSVVLSLLVVFLNIQNRSIYIDYLTGINNRKMLDGYLKKKISASTEDKTFSAIMIDLNNFKAINDTFGHDEGDKALQKFSVLLKSCLRSNDFLARYGGDEFCVVLDTSGTTELENIVRRIRECVKKYNQTGDRPYEFGFSMGYAMYDCRSHIKAEEFQKLIDTLLYEDKQGYKK